jgi:hypothetical protein
MDVPRPVARSFTSPRDGFKPTSQVKPGKPSKRAMIPDHHGPLLEHGNLARFFG